MDENPYKAPAELSKQESPSLKRQRARAFRGLFAFFTILGIFVAFFSALYPVNTGNLLAVAIIFVMAIRA